MCAAAAANTKLLQNNEAATRAALIDPILRALGWDPANVRMVEPERMVANKQSLDYVLKDAQESVRVVVEAKKLGESLDKLGHVGALIGYAFSLKPTRCFLIDGLHWHYYSPAHSSYEPVALLNLQAANPVEAALYLLQWLDAAHYGHGVPPLPNPQPVTSVPAQRPPSTPNQAAPPAAKPRPKPTTNHPQEPAFIAVSHLHRLDLLPSQKPKQLRLPDGTIQAITTWKAVLLELCRLVLATNAHLPIPFSDKAGKKRFLISVDKQPVGASTGVAYQGKTVFVGTNYSREDCLANAMYAAQQLPASHQSTSLSVSF